MLQQELTQAVDLGTGVVWNPEDCKREMEKFVARTFGPESAILASIEYEVAVGKPAAEILRVARERARDGGRSRDLRPARWSHCDPITAACRGPAGAGPRRGLQGLGGGSGRCGFR